MGIIQLEILGCKLNGAGIPEKNSLHLLRSTFPAFPEIVENVVLFTSRKMAGNETVSFFFAWGHQFYLASHSVNAIAYKDLFLLLCSLSDLHLLVFLSLFDLSFIPVDLVLSADDCASCSKCL